MTRIKIGYLHAVILGMGLVFLGIACGDEAPSEATYATGGVGGGLGGDACTAKILVGLFDDDQCENLVFSYKVDIAEPCSGWTREVAGGTKDNSATRFQCFKDRLCYTQYVNTYTCDAQGAAMVEDKEARTTCLDDPTPGIWVKLLGGTESCPDAPSGFQCPVGGGTPGIAAACEGD
ncbi:hypothetical protein [Polyangium sorediatum]|uniref:Lipoprotein n=1 Tax=Polyangium sorediatum TaxID=889274 RepID=A0ABT6NRR6_9BACT|nr:hypothetical protein [Polyangium sorediatum]MDI1430850.1 hypothetical protein [Polyangium sorediatum]